MPLGAGRAHCPGPEELIAQNAPLWTFGAPDGAARAVAFEPTHCPARVSLLLPRTRMKVTRKLMVGVVAATVFVGLANSALRVQRDASNFHEDMRRDHEFVGRTVRSAWVDAWRRGGVASADAMVQHADRAFSQVKVRVLTDGPCAGRGAGEDRTLVDRDDFVSCFPIREVGGALEVRESLEPQRRYFRVSVLRNLLTSLLTAVVVSFIIFTIGERFIGRPIEALRQKSRRVGAGDLTGPLRLGQDDEFGDLAAEINAMCMRLADAQRAAEEHHRASLRAVEDLRHADRLSTVGLLASGLAHELGTPLNVVLARAGLLAEGDSTAGDVVDSARVIAEQTRRMTGMVRQLLDFARQKTDEKGPVDLAALAAQAAAMLQPVTRKAGVDVTVLAPAPRVVTANAGQLHQVLVNLMVNAVQAMPDGGALRLEVGVASRPAVDDTDGAPRRWCFVAVDDEGVGVAPEHRARVFDPFFTTKGVGEGTGLGLSISHSIAREHGGWIAVEPREPRGTRFALFIPAAGT